MSNSQRQELILNDDIHDKDSIITITQWNVLAQKFIKDSNDTSDNQTYLSWDYRRSLIMKELFENSNLGKKNVIGLEECDFFEDIKQEGLKYGYEHSVFSQRHLTKMMTE